MTTPKQEFIQVNDETLNVPSLSVGNLLVHGTDSSEIAAVSAVTFVSGTAKQVNTAQDVDLYIEITLGGTATISFGKTSAGTDVPIITAGTVTTDDSFHIKVPAGWYVKVTLTTATISAHTVTC